MLFLFYLQKEKSPSLDLTSLPATCPFSSFLYNKTQRKRYLYTLSPLPLFLFFPESALKKLLFLPLHHNHSCQYHSWLQVFILLDFQQNLTQLSTPSPPLACRTHSVGFSTTSLTAPFHSLLLVITHFFMLECPRAQSLHLFSFLSILIPLVASSKIMPLNTN